MTTTLEKYDKKQLATLRVDRLVSAVDGKVRALFAALDIANDGLREIEEAAANYKDNEPEVEKIFRAQSIAARRKVSRSIKNINDYIDEQRALFRSRGMNPDRAYTWAIVPVDKKDGSDREQFRLVQRNVTLELNEESDDNDRSVRATMHLPSEKFSVITDMKRGKYRDGSFLFGQAVCGLDRSETIGESE